MRYITRNEMVEIKLALHLKGKMTRRAYKNTHRDSVGVFIYPASTGSKTLIGEG